MPNCPLDNLLKNVADCKACNLMEDNRIRDIPYIPILPKPNAKVIFIGRDPSPNTAKIVGVRGGRSVFINEIFKMIDESGQSEDSVYITDICKCHWRTSAGGHPFPGTEDRSILLPHSIAKSCINQWLIKEIEILKPKLIIAMGEENYQLLKPYIINPITLPKKLSARKDKSIMDAELWFTENGPFTIKLNDNEWQLAILRHPGNSIKLPKNNLNDFRLKYYQRSRNKVIENLIIQFKIL